LLSAGISAQAQLISRREKLIHTRDKSRRRSAAGSGATWSRAITPTSCPSSRQAVISRQAAFLSLRRRRGGEAPPDGYTLLITSVTSSHAANVFNFKKCPIDPIKTSRRSPRCRKLFHLMTGQPPWVSVAALTEAMKIKGDRASYGYGAPPAWPPRSFTRRARPASVGHSVQSSVASLRRCSAVRCFPVHDSTVGTRCLQDGKVPGLRSLGQRGPAHLPTWPRRPTLRIRHRAGVGRAAAGGCASADVARLESWFAEHQPDGRHPAIDCQYSCCAFPGGARHWPISFRRKSRSGRSCGGWRKIEPQ